MAATASATDTTIRGMPRVWQTRLTGWVWLLAYCAIHCSLVRPPSMDRIITDGISLLRRQQESTRRPGMYVAICRHFLMTIDFGALQSEGHDLPFIVDENGARQHDVFGKVCDRFVQIDQAVLAGPEKCPGSKSVCDLADHQSGVVDSEGLAINPFGPIQCLHSGGAGPHKSANASAARRSPHHHSAVIDVIGAAAGVTGQDAQVLHDAVFPEKRMRI